MNLARKGLFIIGGGGHSRVVIDSFLKSGRQIDGIVDPAYEKDELIVGIPVIGGDDILDTFSIDAVRLINGVGVLPGRLGRWKIADDLRQRGFKFVSVVDLEAVVASNVKVSEGAQVLAGCILQNGVKIGSDSVVNTGAIIDHDCNIGEKCWISPGVTICGETIIGSNAYIGTGATLIQNLKIGEGALIRAGATVVEDVQSGETI